MACKCIIIFINAFIYRRSPYYIFIINKCLYCSAHSLVPGKLNGYFLTKIFFPKSRFYKVWSVIQTTRGAWYQSSLQGKYYQLALLKTNFIDFWTLWEKARVGCFKRTASKHVYYLGWNRSPALVGCVSQVLGPGALGRPRGITWRGRWEGGSGWGIHVNPWLIHVNVWQKPLQYCKVISLQLIKINEKQTNKNK